MKGWPRQCFSSKRNGTHPCASGCWSSRSRASSIFRRKQKRGVVALRGKADRIDLLEDRTFRIIDYKLSRAPDRKQALQLPVYTVCTIQHLRKTRGEEWEPGQAGYIAFGQDRQFVPMLARGKNEGCDARRRTGAAARRGRPNRAR